MAQNWTQGSGVYTLTTQLQEKGANNWPPNQIPNTYPPYTTFTQGLGSWGQNECGQLGQNNLTYYSSPVQVGTLTTWLNIGVGYKQNIATKTDGTLWSWGQNNFGQLGQNDVIYRSSPVQVGSGTNWSQVSSGISHTIATKTDNSLWSWGRNLYGQLGLGIASTINRSSPVQVGLLTTWINNTSGRYFSVATKTDGTIWSWGRNNFGQLGLTIASTINRSSPVQVGLLTTWSKITAGSGHILAIKTDGTLWSWGINQYGTLGQNTVVNRSSPVQVGGLTTWLSISAGGYSSFAIKTDGTLWSWGYNGNGELGQNDYIYRSSPVQVGALTNWSKISSGAYHSLATKTDGTLWSWGLNNQGQLGQNNTTLYKSPIQVGTLNTWVQPISGPLSRSSFGLLSQV